MTTLSPCIGFATEYDESFALGGYARALNMAGNPSTVTLLQQTYNASTHGILPALLQPANMSNFLKGAHNPEFYNPGNIEATVANDTELPQGFNSFYSIEQQGTSADISCEFRNLTNTTTPSLIVTHSAIALTWTLAGSRDTIPAEGGGDPYYYGLATNCSTSPLKFPNDLSSTVLTGDYNGQMMLFMACPEAETHNYTLIFGFHSVFLVPATIPYEDLDHTFGCIVCSLRPKTTQVNVHYGIGTSGTSPESGSAGVLQSVVDNSSGKTTYEALGGPIGWHAVTAIMNMMILAQGISTNTVIDQLQNVNAGKANFGWDVDMLPLLEMYLTGAVEYSATVMRSCLSANGTIFTWKNGVPSNMTRAVTGTFTTETLGLAHAEGTALGARAGDPRRSVNDCHHHPGAGAPSARRGRGQGVRPDGSRAPRGGSCCWEYPRGGPAGVEKQRDVKVVLDWDSERGPALLRAE